MFFQVGRRSIGSGREIPSSEVCLPILSPPLAEESEVAMVTCRGAADLLGISSAITESRLQASFSSSCASSSCCSISEGSPSSPRRSAASCTRIAAEATVLSITFSAVRFDDTGGGGCRLIPKDATDTVEVGTPPTCPAATLPTRLSSLVSLPLAVESSVDTSWRRLAVSPWAVSSNCRLIRSAWHSFSASSNFCPISANSPRSLLAADCI
mmetsp:Transcript_66827/g.153191  ORF Transcript_66827/g.153191 Transcript_66827/m.153191 type:complete len:211 (+) Transcript_66827:262-894(+)